MKPVWNILYQSKEVSDAIAPFVTKVTYTDHEHAKSDEIEIEVEDSELLWRTGWFPAEGDRIVLEIGREGQPLLPCGSFQVDEVSLDAPPRTCKIRAMAAGIDSSLRTKKNRAFEDTTLKEIATAVAEELNLTLLGEVSDDPIERATQNDETSLSFLTKLADERGYAFSVRDATLVFYKLSDLEAAPPVLTLSKSDLKTGYSFRSGTQHTYIACEVSFFDPVSGESLSARAWVENLRVRGDVETEALPEVPHDLHYDPPGDNRDDDVVGEWQAFLQTQGEGSRGLYDYTVDNWFLDITAAGTAKFQEQAGIPVNGKLVDAQTWRAAIEAGFRGGAQRAVLGEVLYESLRCESIADAERKAAAILHRANRLKATGSFRTAGNQFLCSGVKVTLEGLQRLSGDWLLQRATHTMTRGGGYETSVEVTFVP